MDDHRSARQSRGDFARDGGILPNAGSSSGLPASQVYSSTMQPEITPPLRRKPNPPPGLIYLYMTIHQVVS